MRTLHRERALVKSLVDLGLTTEQAVELLMHPVHSTSEKSSSSAPKTASTHGSAKEFTAQTRKDVADDVVEEKKTFSISPRVAEYLEGLVDASDRQEGGGVILFWNDLTADARYAKSDPSLQAVGIASSRWMSTSNLQYNLQLLRVYTMSLFSPMLRIRQNLVNVIFVLDLSQMRSLSLLNTLSEHFVARGFPVRWGFVPEGQGDSEFENVSLTVQCSLCTRSSDGSTGIPR